MRIKRTYHCILIFFFTALPLTGIYAQSGVAYTDTSHYSPAFGHQKAYRLYLPQGYQKAGKRYPVIYFFHGWGGRHFKDDNALLEYDKIKLLVDKYQSILVMWDGNIDTTEPRPYNTGDHGDIKYMVQEKDYFPELIAHIDSAYRTLPGRQHRGIIGFSMGGFMAFFLAGKYPEKVTAAVSFAGSPEFFVGSPADHTLYPVRYAFKNLADVNIQLHNGDSDILYFLNEEVKEGAGWEDVKLDYRKFHGGHMIDKTGETTAFDMAMKFVLKSFNKKPAPKPRWSHYDLYPAFGAWDYSIQTNKKEPGYLFLRQVGKTGFGFYTRKWLPDGPPVNIDSAMVSTAAIYKPGRQYRIIIYESKTGKLQEDLQKADTSGRLSFNNAPETETGIYEEGDNASFIFLDHTTRTNSRYLQNRKSGSLSLRLFNRAGTRPWPEKIIETFIRTTRVSASKKTPS
ncbi:MAG: alpha/beta fold hydrolase [Ferruginibacter sp.]